MESDATRSSAASAADVAQRLRASNRKVAWTLASIAAVFFAGIIATRWVGGGVGIGVMGAVVLLFLVVAIGRNLRRADDRAGEGADPKDAPAREGAHPVAQRQGPSDAASGVRR
jgi:hypothetical protein